MYFCKIDPYTFIIKLLLIIIRKYYNTNGFIIKNNLNWESFDIGSY